MAGRKLISGTTIAPLHGLSVSEPMNSPVQIGDKIFLEHFEQLPKGKNWRKYFGVGDCMHLEDATLAFSSSFQYRENAFDHQLARKTELSIMHALLALWIFKPSSARVTHFFHFETQDLARVPHTYNRLFHTFFATRNDIAVSPEELDTGELSTIFQNIQTAFRERQPLRIALWHLFSSQRMPEWETRFVSLCVVLESLFSCSVQEITHKLSERVAMFLGDNGGDNYTQYKKIKAFYSRRSKIVHGQDFKVKGDAREIVQPLEEVVHRVLRKILADSSYVTQFNKKNKEEYLTKLLFNQGRAE